MVGAVEGAVVGEQSADVSLPLWPLHKHKFSRG